jgi:L-threonylcarbamoyladenylate synthase
MPIIFTNQDLAQWPERFADAINSERIVIAPCETVYCICFNPLKTHLVDRALAVKSRLDRKFISMIWDLDSLKKLNVSPNPLEQIFIDKFWPGPLTIAFSDQLAVRMVKEPWLREALKRVQTPLVAATSANLTGQPSVYEASELNPLLLDRVDVLFVGDGFNPQKTVSTLVRLKTGIEVLRKGAVDIPPELFLK